MSAFTGPLRLEHLDADWRKWMLLEPLVWQIDEVGSGKLTTVPAGFVFDGASTPRWVWAFLPPTGSYMRAAGLHDYYLDCLARGECDPWAPTRAKADRQFLIAMKALKVAFVVRWPMYLAVRVHATFSRLSS